MFEYIIFIIEIQTELRKYLKAQFVPNVGQKKPPPQTNQKTKPKPKQKTKTQLRHNFQQQKIEWFFYVGRMLKTLTPAETSADKATRKKIKGLLKSLIITITYCRFLELI